MQIACTQCHQQVSNGQMGTCSNCQGILKPEYPDEILAQLKTIQPGPGIDRYRSLLPATSTLPYLGEGDTPLIPSTRLKQVFGMKRLYFKNEGCNPSGAFKDRGGSLAAALAIDSAQEGIITASSGNAGAAISAYSTASGIKCALLLEPGAPPNKLRQALATGAMVIPVKGIFSHGPTSIKNLINDLAQRLNYYPAFIWAPVNPYIIEAFKTISYEIVARLGSVPDVVVCPVGGGDLFTAQWRGYQELKRCGLINKLPRMIAVQSFSAPPLLEAFLSGADQVTPLPYANSKISGINVPFTGDHALESVHTSEGTVIGVDENEVFKFQKRLGTEEGIWVEPASAAPLAALDALISKGLLEKNERVVCIMSGAGFKDTFLAQKDLEAISNRNSVEFDIEQIIAKIK